MDSLVRETGRTSVDPAFEILEKLVAKMAQDPPHLDSSIDVTSCVQVSLIHQLLESYSDFLSEDFVLPSMRDDIEILGEGLTFCLSFIMDPQQEDSEGRELILGQFFSIFTELPSLTCSIHCNQMKQRISESKLSGFLQKMAGVEAEVRKLYAINISQFNSPRINAIRFMDSLLQKLNKWLLDREVKFTARVKQGIQIVLKELPLLRAFMENVTEPQNELDEFKVLWTRIVNLVYYTAYVTNLCIPKSSSIWYGIIYLPSVIEEINLIKNEVREIKDRQMYTNKSLSVKMEPGNALLPQPMALKVEGAL